MNVLMDVLKSQMILGTDNNKSIKKIIINMIILLLIDKINNIIPEITEFIKNYLHNKYKKINIDNLITNDTREIVSSIKYILEPSSVCCKSASLMYHINKINNVKNVVYKKGSFILSDSCEIEIYEHINVKLISFIEGHDDTPDIINLILYSYTKPLQYILNFVKKIELEYDLYARSSLTQLHYFQECEKKINNNYASYNIANDSIRFRAMKFNTNKNMSNIFGEEIDKIKSRLDFFIDNPNFYTRLGIPHTLGILLSGAPGTGKTSCIKAIASYTNRHVINVSLKKTTTTDELFNLFHNDRLETNNSPSGYYAIPTDKRLYVIEDIDCLTDIALERKLLDVNKPKCSNENKADDKAENVVTLSFLLNLLDGVLEIPGRIVILTSNFPEKLDSALLRPGRIDLSIKFGNCKLKTISDIFFHFYNIKITPSESCDDKITPAELIKILCSNSDHEKAYQEIISYCNT